jgi:hypothetical protein
MLDVILPLLVILTPFVVLLVVIKTISNKQTPTAFPYKKKDSILTAHEQQYFRHLEQQYGESNYILCQVALDRIVNTTDQKNFYTYWNKINKKSIDFVIVDKQTFQTVKLIELNDKTHSYNKRIQRDEFLVKLCESAGIKLELVK